MIQETLTTQVKDEFVNSIGSIVKEINELWPYILASIGLIILGLIIAVLVEKMVIKSSNKLKLGWITEKIGLMNLMKKAEIRRHPAEIIGGVLKGYIFTIFLISACRVVELDQIANFLDSIIAYIPKIVVSLIIMLIGVKIADTVAGIVHSALVFTSKHVAQIISGVARYSLIFFSILAALAKLSIPFILIEVLFIGFISLIVLGGGLAIGLGGKDIAKKLIEDIRQKELNGKNQKKS